MVQIERICPNCGTSNAADRAQCINCGLDLNRLPAQSQSNLPLPLEGAGVAALVMGATALIARAGLRLLARGVANRINRALIPRPNPTAVERKTTEEQPDYVVWGWRSWSVRQGEQHSSGSEQFEWRVKRKEGGRP